MDIQINAGIETEWLNRPTEVVKFIGEKGEDGEDASGEFDGTQFIGRAEWSDAMSEMYAAITLNASQIQLKVSKSDFDAFGNRLSIAETLITQTATSITLRATKEEVEQLRGVVTQQQTLISQTATAISLRATKVELDALGNRLSLAESSITQTANAISLKVSKSDFDAFSGQVGTKFSQIEQNAASISLRVQGLPTVEYVNSQLATIPYNGLNLYNSTTPLFYNASSLNERNNSGFNITGIQQNTGEVRLGGVIKSNGSYTLSFYARASTPLLMGVDFCDGSNMPFTITNELKYFTFTYNVTNYNNVYNFVDIKGFGAQVHYFEKVKVEKGTRATEWTPDIGDLTEVLNTYSTKITQLESSITLLATKNTTDALGNRLATAEASINVQATQIQNKVNVSTYNSLQERVSNAESTITQQAGLISSKVSETTFNTLTGRVTNAESAINQTNSQINLKVSKTDFTGATIASLINLSPEEIKISAAKINLEGAVTADRFSSGFVRINMNPNGDFEFLHRNGKVAFLMTTEGDKAVLRGFNNKGGKVFDIDTISTGQMKYIDIVATEMVPVQISRATAYNTASPSSAEQDVMRSYVRSKFVQTQYGPEPGYSHTATRIEVKGATTTFYEFINGVYPDSAEFDQYNGYHVDGNYASAFIPNGWYVKDGLLGSKYHPADVPGAQMVYATLIGVVNGKQVAQFSLDITV